MYGKYPGLFDHNRSVGLFSSDATIKEAKITGNPGMGEQSILVIPVVYNGWVQNLPASWSNQLTPDQRDPIHSP